MPVRERDAEEPGPRTGGEPECDGAPGPGAPDELPNLLPERRRLPLGWRVAALVGGSLCMLLGFVGWLVPIVTGIPFYVLGLGLLGLASRRVRHGINVAERHLPTKVRLLLRRRRKGGHGGR